MGVKLHKGVKMEVSGTPMELPKNLQVGQRLKDSNINMTMDLGIMKTTAVVKMTDGRCLAIENVTVSAGKFKCHKITQTVTTTAMGVNSVTRIVSWYYAPGVKNSGTFSWLIPPLLLRWEYCPRSPLSGNFLALFPAFLVW